MEKQTVFIKRYPSKGEFPKEDVFAVLTKNGKMFGFDVTERTEWWLEEIELPSEEEIYFESGKKSKRTFQRFIDGANFIINYLNKCNER